MPITVREVAEKSEAVDFTLSVSGPRLTGWLIARLDYRNHHETTVSGYAGVHWLTVLLVIVLPLIFALVVGLIASPVEPLGVIAAVVIYAVVLSVYFIYSNILKGELIDQLRSKLTK
jgi:Flp pilus assembly protein TadB